MREMIKNSVTIMLLFVCGLLQASGVAEPEKTTVTGRVYNAWTKQPLANVQITSQQSARGVFTDSLGQFKLQVSGKTAIIQIQNVGFFTQEIALDGRDRLTVYLLPAAQFMRTDNYTGPVGVENYAGRQGSAFTLTQQDVTPVYNSPEEVLHGRIPGLRVMTKGGMPGEGAAVHMRGIRSFAGENMPLIVVDGVPYMPGLDNSEVVRGFSKNAFTPVNMKEVQKITLLKGADAAVYGSLGGNGVLLIETDKAMDLKTKIEFSTVEGVSFIHKRIPLLKSQLSKSYLGDIGENKYADPELLVKRLPFLLDDPDDLQGFRYRNETDWQDEIYTPALVSENILKVTGGDAVAKYMLTFGTQQNGGVIENTHQSKYLARFNTHVAFSKRLKATAMAALNYSDYKLQEQGMEKGTNPLLTALYQAPFLSVYKQGYNTAGMIETLPFYNTVDPELQLSNPAAVVNEIKAGVRSYDVIVNMGLDFEVTRDLSMKGAFGLYYTYNKEDIFIPGKNQQTIAFSGDSVVRNMVRSGISEGKNYYGKAEADYHKLFGAAHDLRASAGFQLFTVRNEYDMGEGVNTPTDFYTILSKTTYAKKVRGGISKWSWMNAFASVSYNYNKQFYLTGALAADRASSFGVNSQQWFFFPSVKGAWRLDQANFLRENPLISELTLRGEYGINGNSRFSSRYGRYTYTAEPYRTSGGIYREGLPNTLIGPERVYNSNIGAELALLGDRFRIQVDFYQEQVRRMLLANLQPVFAGFEYGYENRGELDTRGVEVSLGANLLNRKDWTWYVGATVTHHRSEIKSLGNEQQRTIEFSDGAQLLVKEGESPYLFYGSRAEKVFYSSEEALNTGYRAQSGQRFVAGDIRFSDVNGDRVINDDDRVILGDPTPDFYGAFYTDLRYKNWGLFANFTYSYGNDIYNAVRRSTGAMKDFSNQDLSVAHRWMVDGQVTDIPRAAYGDPAGNSRFSSRWIEDGSFLKLKEVTLSYETDKKFLFFNKLKVYVTGENLFTVSNYLGLDPEFSYSYDPTMLGMDMGKIPVPKSAKLGLILNF